MSEGLNTFQTLIGADWKTCDCGAVRFGNDVMDGRWDSGFLRIYKKKLCSRAEVSSGVRDGCRWIL